MTKFKTICIAFTLLITANAAEAKLFTIGANGGYYYSGSTYSLTKANAHGLTLGINAGVKLKRHEVGVNMSLCDYTLHSDIASYIIANNLIDYSLYYRYYLLTKRIEVFITPMAGLSNGGKERNTNKLFRYGNSNGYTAAISAGAGVRLYKGLCLSISAGYMYRNLTYSITDGITTQYQKYTLKTDNIFTGIGLKMDL